MDFPGTYVRVFDEDGNISVELDDEPRVDAAVQRWIDSGRTRDTVLSLTCLDGSEIHMLASKITTWYVSTPESRRLQVEFEAAYQQELRQMRAAAGWMED